jgi:hypothetical protein
MTTEPRVVRSNEPAESRSDKSRSARSDEEERVWQVLEEARQNVKRLTKRELEAELLPSDLLSFRLKRGR